jgi:hypothetical protein
MRGLRINSQLSAWAQINGHFDFNHTPLAPPGLRVLVHEKPQNRETWSPHALDGWYIGPALETYQCYNVWLWDTCAMNEFVTPFHGSPSKSQCHLHRPQTLSGLVFKTSSRHYRIQQQTLHWHHAQIARCKPFRTSQASSLASSNKTTTLHHL